MEIDEKACSDDGLVRAFVCIDFDDEVIMEIARVQELISKTKFVGKLTELENLHLTLKFLGEINGEEVEKIKEKLSEIKFKTFEAKLGRIGIFHFKGMPRIVWIKLEGKGIYDLQKEIDEKLGDLFKKEERFMGHLTIARIKYVNDKKKFEEKILKIPIKKIKFKIRGFKLKSSELKRTGPIYKDLWVYKSED
ncbi:MAG: RNA 2',3'-cyclic phosphodiesterase [Candidatus Pacearchaeota archaeon]|nr:RNA 2',3'-cyclic phosphodiesterase [Candidatus Pacearchaeota archaeon]